MTTENPIFLIVDDSEHDSRLIRIAFENAGVVEPLQFASDGEKAIAYLRGDGRYGDRRQFPLPTVVLLDLNMARKNGFDVLEWIRLQPALERLCVHILSASCQAEDIQRAHELGANSYLVKPDNLDGLMHLANCLVRRNKLSQFAPQSDASDVRDRRSMHWFAMAGDGGTELEHATGQFFAGAIRKRHAPDAGS